MVIEAAQELNYHINTRLLNTVYNFKKTYHVALISQIHVGEFYASFFNGLDQASKKSNIILGLYNIEEEVDVVIDLLKSLSNDNLDAAVLFLPSLKEHDYYKIIEDTPSDFFLISAASLFHPVLDTVTFDSYRGGYLAAKHYEEQGYVDLGFISGPTFRQEALLRKGGYTDYINHRSDMKLIWQYEGDYTYDCGKAAFHDMKKSGLHPRAVFASNDYSALGFIEEALKDGVDIPGDIAVCGFDNLPICEIVQPKLTTIGTNFVDLGHTIFNVIKEKMEKREGHRGVSSIVPVEIIVRDST